MNTDDDSNTLHPWIEPELEARLTALVLGEASDFERDELERLVAERPELGLYRKRLEVMHRMLHEVAQGESGEGQEDWKLSGERRDAVVARIGGEAANENKVMVMSGPKRRLPWGMVVRIAACVTVAALVLSLMYFSAAKSEYRAGRLAETGDFDAILSHKPPAQKEWQHYPGQSSANANRDLEAKELALADRAISRPAVTTATPAPPAEPIEVNNSGQIGALNGTVALGSGGDLIIHSDPNSQSKLSVVGPAEDNPSVVRVGGDFQGRPTRGRPLERDHTSFPQVDHGGTFDTKGGSLAITNPDPAADSSPADPAAPAIPMSATAEPASDLAETPEDRLARYGDFDGGAGAGAKLDGTRNDFSGSSRASGGLQRAKIDPAYLATGTTVVSSADEIREKKEKLKTIIIPSVEFKDTPLKDALKFLQEKSAELDLQETDPARKGIQIVADAGLLGSDTSGELETSKGITEKNEGFGFESSAGGGGGVGDTRITLRLSNVPLAEALRYTTSLAQLKYKVEEDEVRVVPISTPDADLFTNVYTVPPTFLSLAEREALGGASAAAPDPFADPVSAGGGGVRGRTNAKEILESAGITFSPGSSVIYNPETSQLIVRNTEDQMELVEAFASSLGAGEEKPGAVIASPTTLNRAKTSGERAFGAGGAVASSGDGSGMDFVDPFGGGAAAGAPTLAGPVNIEGNHKTKDHVIRRELPIAENEARSQSRTINFGTATSTIEDPSGFSEVTESGFALPGLQSDKQTFRFSVQAGSERTDAELETGEPWTFGRAAEVDKSVQDILALTPQVDLGNDRELSTLYASTETEGRFRMARVPGKADFDNQRLEMLKEVAETWDSPAPAAPAAPAETSPEAEPFSTFSLHVSDVSFQLARAALASGKWPDVEKIRIEEFVNAFDYGDPMPAMEERVAARIDQAAHPFLQQRNLVRIALRTAEAGRSAATPLRLTLLLDSSGSMERPDRRETVRRAVATLAGLLGENDRITLVSFARQPRLVADAVSGDEAMKLAATVAALPSEGGTNLEAALQLAFEKAREHQGANAQNRIVLLTDGAANLGDAKAGSLASLVEGMREAGIAFDAAGFGAEGLNDEILEALTRKGDGRYYLLDRPEDAEETFAKQIAGALRPAAKNVKVQVEFNPDRVKSYKLLGFEKHRLETEDFRNDAVDAAELAAAEAGVAVYQVEPNPAGQGDLGSVSVRFRDLDSGEMVERRWAVPHLATAPAADQGGDAILLATVASQFAAKLAGGPLGDVVDLGELARLAAALPDGPRVKELRTMIEQARGIQGQQ